MDVSKEKGSFASLAKQGVDALATLPPLHQKIAGPSSIAWQAYLQQRQRLLGTGTLSSTAIQTICDISTALGITDLHQRILTHAPSFSAREKQELLPNNVYVQKTLTASFHTHNILCSGVGDWRMTKDLQRHIGHQLRLSSRASKTMTLNPATINPSEQLGMLPGMVSPFLDPTYTAALQVVVIIAPPNTALQAEFSVSLSLHESLLLPVEHFSKLIRLFLAHQHPNIAVIEYVAGEED